MLILLLSLGGGPPAVERLRAVHRGAAREPLAPGAAALTLAASRAAVLGRLTRAAVLDTVHRGFVQFARAKGLAKRAVLFRHVLPNAAIPIVTVIGLQVGYMLGGAIVVETIFALPGVGRMTLDAVLERNYPVVQSAAAGRSARCSCGEPRDRRALRRDRPAASGGDDAGTSAVAARGSSSWCCLSLLAVAAPLVLPGSPTEIASTAALRAPTARRAVRHGRPRPQRAEPRDPRAIESRSAWRWPRSPWPLLIGLPLGLLAGYAEGVLDQLIMRPLDVLMAFPAILLAIALMSVFGTGALLVSVALGDRLHADRGAGRARGGAGGQGRGVRRRRAGARRHGSPPGAASHPAELPRRRSWSRPRC